MRIFGILLILQSNTTDYLTNIYFIKMLEFASKEPRLQHYQYWTIEELKLLFNVSTATE